MPSELSRRLRRFLIDQAPRVFEPKGDAVATVPARGRVRPLHPLHAILLAFPLPLFLGALLGDLAYRASFEVQWINFSAWLIAGALLVGAFALLWALIGLLRSRVRGSRSVLYVV